ncbi:ABC transporter ATP-binding protein [Burkholderia multivorans]|uniref:dipeptide ABC transporter ATP-binding protein n=1 Tax=Burkholderia multivorans TaxID=87883 RepID=UPI001C220BC0|nr:ABC transporter ATP-binding protein [Burkholderia multivorans]MBU9185754.1 ABC transporter ATP-binding protein [Burkholderia multivorans]MBU9284092.1 ABC transporter ATP-binding protein [Burkholderia multivorans]MBU9420752.1 ABC transporter ATP-binding protein [Burkholderia multivorans]MDN7451282.1 ABC transporter ATP-binding protein [Burkholderia multivorans]
MNNSLLNIKDLVLGLPGREPIVNGVSFSIAPGEFVAVVGESGSGKTMVARSVLGLLPEQVRMLGGEIEFDGQSLGALERGRVEALRGARIGMVFQEPMTSLNPSMRIGDIMTEGLKRHTTVNAATRRAACINILKRIGIDRAEQCLRAFPHEFSGGMRQRIMLASVMLLRPALLIADEPTTALDTITQREVMELMQELARESGTAVMLITHNLGLVARYASRAVVLCKGREIEQGPATALLANPKEDYTRELVAAIPAREARDPIDRGALPILEARAVSVVHQGRRTLLGKRTLPVPAVSDVSFTLHAGETLAIVGGSGSGKSTLSRAIVQLVPVSNGRLYFRGKELTEKGPARQTFRKECQMIFQDPYSSLNPRMRIDQIVGEPLLRIEGMRGDERTARVAAVLKEVGLDGFANRYPHQMSGGQRQRVAIARAIVVRPALILADEPTSALDMTLQKQILALFKQLQKEYGFACIFVSHDLAVVEQICDRILVMEKGRVVEAGERDAVLDHPTHPYTKSLLSASPHLDLPRPTYDHAH